MEPQTKVINIHTLDEAVVARVQGEDGPAEERIYYLRNPAADAEDLDADELDPWAAEHFLRHWRDEDSRDYPGLVARKRREGR